MKIQSITTKIFCIYHIAPLLLRIGIFSRPIYCKTLVWYEAYNDVEEARHRELKMKKWKRLWRLRVIEEINPDWNDLFESLI